MTVRLYVVCVLSMISRSCLGPCHVQRASISPSKETGGNTCPGHKPHPRFRGRRS